MLGNLPRGIDALRAALRDGHEALGDSELEELSRVGGQVWEIHAEGLYSTSKASFEGAFVPQDLGCQMTQPWPVSSRSRTILQRIAVNIYLGLTPAVTSEFGLLEALNRGRVHIFWFGA